jgi:hypothetical protein
MGDIGFMGFIVDCFVKAAGGYGLESDVWSEVEDLAAVRIPAVVIIMLKGNLLGARSR